jgi:MoaA/NifB/PqqE/SkfB family radical SAM enzyme
MPRAVFERLVDELRELGTRRLDVAGTGEPLLHPEALHMLQYVTAAGIRCVLITNGSMLTPDACRRLVETGLDSLNVSLNSATDETHHRITQAAVGQRSHIVGMLRRLVASRSERGVGGPCISVSFIVQRDNCHEIVQMAREAVRLGIDNVEFAPLGINEASRDLALSPTDQVEATKQLARAQDILDRGGVHTNARHCLGLSRGADWSRAAFAQTPCCVGHLFCRVLADGAVDPCGVSRRVVGDVTQQSLGEIWSSSAYRAFRREALGLPTLGRELDGCSCYTCGHAQRAPSYHEKVRDGRFHEIL